MNSPLLDPMYCLLSGSLQRVQIVHCTQPGHHHSQRGNSMTAPWSTVGSLRRRPRPFMIADCLQSFLSTQRAAAWRDSIYRTTIRAIRAHLARRGDFNVLQSILLSLASLHRTAALLHGLSYSAHNSSWKEIFC